MVIRHAANLEYASIIQFQNEQRLALFLGLAGDVQLGDDLILIICTALAGVDVNTGLNIRGSIASDALLGQNVFERHITHILRDNPVRHDGRLRWLLRCCVLWCFVFGHLKSPQL